MSRLVTMVVVTKQMGLVMQAPKGSWSNQPWYEGNLLYLETVKEWNYRFLNRL